MARLIGCLLAVISAGCTAHWLWGLSLAAMGTLAAGVTAACGLLLEGAKFALKPTDWSVKLALSLLMLLSMTSTYFYLESSLRESTVSPAVISRLNEQVADIDWQITQVRANAERLAEMDYLSRSQEHMEDLKELRTERMRLMSEQTELEKVVISPVMEQFSWIIFLLVAVLVDVVAFLCLREQVPNGSDVQKPTDPEEFQALPFDTDLVKAEVAAGDLPHTISAIREKYGCRHEKAALVLDSLVTDGVLEVTGGKRKKYRPATKGKLIVLSK